MILSKADDDVSVGFDLQQGATCDERAGGVKGSSERGISPGNPQQGIINPRGSIEL